MTNGLKRYNTGTFESDLERCQRTSKDLLKFILTNRKTLLRHKNGSKLYNDALDISKSQELTPKQISYIDGIYEKLMGQLGFESFTPTFKPTRRGAGL